MKLVRTRLKQKYWSLYSYSLCKKGVIEKNSSNSLSYIDNGDAERHRLPLLENVTFLLW